jgi:tetratricopeptide (TPR) repeat protein
MNEREATMKRYTLFILLAFLALTGRAQETVEKWFEQANAAYNAGNYDSAVRLYEDILTYDVESAPLYYNMGNAYYKKRDYPMAIYCYEKALKIDPSDDDARTNLEMANLAIVDKIEPVPQSFLVKGWNGMRNWLSGDQWAYVSIVAFALLLVAVGLFLRSGRMGMRKLGFFGGIVMLIVFGLSVLFAAQFRKASLTEDQAIVMTPTVTVKSSPNTSSIDLFVLHEGTKVDLLDEADGWSKIKIANGSIGWLQTDFILPF